MDEPNALLRWTMFHFAGGDALFVAILLLILVSFAPEEKKSAWRWTLITALLLIWGGLSSPAWPIRTLVVVAALVLFWRLAVHVRERSSPAIGVMTWCLRGVLFLLIYIESTKARGRVRPDYPYLSELNVIGDSITAGLNDGEITWPRILAERTGARIRDASQPGATFRSAIRQAEALHDDDTPLLLEIGGNDLLSGVTLAEFSRDCEDLCEQVRTPALTVVMCELPLPPGKSLYGAEQRRICRKHGILLIPKRKMMQILTTAGATVDGIHLSAKGQKLFCDMIQETFRTPAFIGFGFKTDYQKIERRSNSSAVTNEEHGEPLEALAPSP